MKNEDGTIDFYSIDRSGKTVEHGPVSLNQALRIIDDRFSRLKPRYETAEEALAETMFGFSLSKDTFVEICIQTLTEIAFKFEHPLGKRFFVFQSVYQNESKLSSREELVERVKMFFGTSAEAFEQYIETSRK